MEEGKSHTALQLQGDMEWEREIWKLISISPSPEIERGRYGIGYSSRAIQLQGLFQQFLPVDMTYGSGVIQNNSHLTDGLLGDTFKSL